MISNVPYNTDGAFGTFTIGPVLQLRLSAVAECTVTSPLLNTLYNDVHT